MHDFDVVLLEDETGGYVAIVPALPGCHTQGHTLAEVMENAKEAIDLYLETLTTHKKSQPPLKVPNKPLQLPVKTPSGPPLHLR